MFIYILFDPKETDQL